MPAGQPYEDEQRQPYADNHRRFALLGFVAAQLAQGLDPDWQPQVVHCHDWHAGLAPAYMAFAARGSGRAWPAFTPCTTWPTRACSTPSISVESGTAARMPSAVERPGVLRPDVVHEGGLCSTPTASPPSARPTRRRSRRPSRAADSMACCGRAATCCPASSMRWTRRCGTRRMMPRFHSPFDARKQPQARRVARRRLQQELGLAVQADAPLVWRRQPPDRAEGLASGARRAGRAARPGRATGGAGQRRGRRWSRHFGRGRRPSAVPSQCTSATTKTSPTACSPPAT